MAEYRLSIPTEAQRPQAYASDGTDAVGFIQYWGEKGVIAKEKCWN
jgi:hypothetical protein